MNSLLRSILRAPETITVVLLLAAISISALYTPEFRDAKYLFRQTSDYAETGVMALAMTLVIISGNIDLSIAAGLALVACISARLHAAGLPMQAVIPVAILVGLALGLFNGLLIAKLRLPSLVVTLGTLALYRGMAQVLAGDEGIGGFPRWFNGIDRVRIGGMIPVPFILLLVLAVIVGLILHRTTFGRRVYALGTNEAATRFAGIRTDGIKLSVFLISGAAMGLTALLTMSRLRAVDYKTAVGDELAVITAVVLGGTSIFGGRGTIFGTVTAWLLLFILRAGMELREWASQYQMAVTGSLLVVSVILANLTSKLGAERDKQTIHAEEQPMQNVLRCLILLAAMSLLVSCGKSDNSSATTGGGDGKLKAVYIPKNNGNPYFDPLIEGFRKAAEETGMDFTSVGPADASPTSQLSLIKAQIQRGAKIVAISPNSPEALNSVFEEAMQEGVTVITVDSDLTGNEQYRTAAVLTVDPETVGKSQIELLGSLIGYKGKFAILSATTNAPNQNLWIDYMKKAMKDPKYKDMELVEVVYGNDEDQKSATETEALLTKYPDLKGIIAPTTVGVRAAAQVIESAGKASQVQVTGLGTPDQMRRFIQNGTVKAFALWSPYDEGYLAGHMAYQIASKKLTPAPGTKFEAGKLGQREFRDKNIVITGPPVTFTKENIDQFHF